MCISVKIRALACHLEKLNSSIIRRGVSVGLVAAYESEMHRLYDDGGRLGDGIRGVIQFVTFEVSSECAEEKEY